MYQGPGAYLTANNRYAQLLAKQQQNNGTNTGGLAHVLQQYLLGSSVAKDEQQQTEANQALMQGLNPQMPQGEYGPPQQGSAQLAQAQLGSLSDNPYAGRMAQMLAMEDLARQQQMAQLAAQQRYQEKRDERQFGYSKELEGLKREGRLSDKFEELSVADRMARSRDMENARNKAWLDAGVEPPSSSGGPRVSPPVQPAPPGEQRTTQGNTVQPQPGPQSLAEARARQAAMETRAKKETEASVKKEAGFRTASNAINEYRRKSETVVANIDKALANIKGGWSTGAAANASYLPWGTDARELNNYLETIKANIGFDNLQKMREASPTGGALGAVSERENALLQAVSGAMDPYQKDQLIKNLTTIRELYPQVLAEKEAAFKSDYGSMLNAGGGDYEYIPGKGVVPKAQ